VNGSDAANNPPGSRRSNKRQPSADSEATVDHKPADPEAQIAMRYSLADEVIRNLRVASYQVMAAVDYNNDIVEKSAQAFAKIAGRDWTFYVGKLSVIIGRPNAKQRGSIDGQAQAEPLPRPLADLAVDIDLGPDQQVSRMHSEIAFDQNENKWCIIVNGRNGLSLDNVRIEAGQRAWLHSGMVISILGTQMMFMLPGSPPDIHPDIQKHLLGEEDEESESGAKDEKQPPPGPGRRRGRASSNYQNSSQAQQRAVNASQLSTLPGSPVDGLPGTPVAKIKESAPPRSKPSPTYSPAGIVMDGADDIDYSADSSKDIKPPHSYASMIGQAILADEEENATLARIYDFIRENYAYFRHNGGGWQNSIRHNLSLSKCFEKIPRRTDEPGKGMKWRIVSEYREEFFKKNMQSHRPRTFSSAPNSPANLGPGHADRLGALSQPGSAKEQKNSRSVTPTLGSFPNDESLTPERGHSTSFLRALDHSQANYTPPTKTEAITPTFVRNGLSFPTSGSGDDEGHGQAGHNATAAEAAEGLRAMYHSPPTLAQGMYSDGPVGPMSGGLVSALSGHLFTPLVPRRHPAPMLQSTCKAPSFYAKDLFSSPAPFWKYMNMSTPARLPEPSPTKDRADEHDEDDYDDDEDDDGRAVSSSPTKVEYQEDDVEMDGTKKTLPVHPSSPPVLPAPSSPTEVVSPCRTVSRPASRHLDMVSSSLAVASKRVAEAAAAGTPPTLMKLQPSAKLGSESPERDGGRRYAPLPAMMGLTAGAGAEGLGPREAYRAMAMDDDEEEINIDLTR
jgi:forkhead protein FKH